MKCRWPYALALVGLMAVVGCSGGRLPGPGHLRAYVSAPPSPLDRLLPRYGIARVRLAWDAVPGVAGPEAGYRVVRVSGERLDIRSEIAELPAGESDVSLLLVLPDDEATELFEVVAFDAEGRESPPSASGLVRAERYPSAAGLFPEESAGACAPAGRVSVVLGASDGSVWFGSEGGGLVRLQNGALRRWERTDGLLSDQVTCLVEGTEGQVWVGTTKGLQVGDGASWTGRWSEPDGFARGPVEGLARDARGNVWVAADGALWRVVGGRGAPWRLTGPGEEYVSTGNPLLDLEVLAEREAWGTLVAALGAAPVVRALDVDAQGRLWVATGGGGLIRRESERAWRVVASLPRGGGAARENLPALPGKVSGLVVGSGGRAWVSDEGGVFLFDPSAGWRRFSLPLEATGRRVLGLAEGADGAAVALVGGRLLSCPPSRERCEAVGGMAPGGDGNWTSVGRSNGSLWLGGADGRVARGVGGDAGAQELALPCRDAAPVAEAVAVVKGDGRVLWTSDGRRIAKLDLDRGVWEAQPLPGPLSGAAVGRMALDASGKLFVATSRGVAVRSEEPAKWTGFPISVNRAVEASAPLAVGSGSRVWSAAYGGLGYFDAHRRGVVPAQNEALEVLALGASGDGRMWAGTPDGLRWISGKDNRLEAIARDEGLPKRVEALADGDGGFLWVVGRDRVAHLHLYGGGATPLPLPGSWADEEIAAAVEVRAGALAVVTRSGRLVCVYPELGEVVERPPVARRGETLEVHGLAVDEDGGGWLATSGRGLVLLPHLCR